MAAVLLQAMLVTEIVQLVDNHILAIMELDKVQAVAVIEAAKDMLSLDINKIYEN
jgi:hypothetical protein